MNVNAVIEEATKHNVVNGMAPSVFKTTMLDGSIHVGFNFQPVGTTVGTLFHYDHGVGIEKNKDAEVVWMKA